LYSELDINFFAHQPLYLVVFQSYYSVFSLATLLTCHYYHLLYCWYFWQHYIAQFIISDAF